MPVDSGPQQLELCPDAVAALPAYRVRESARARYVSIQISLHGDIEVVVPQGYDTQQVPAIVAQRRQWIGRHVAKLQKRRQDLAPEHFEERPSCLQVRSHHETWHISYDASQRPRLELVQTGTHHLNLRGPLADPHPIADLLRQWLTRRARAGLAPWLRELSFDLDLPFNRVSFRGQKTRWASCSSQRNISLNYKLLFLPPELVQYVFVHELCHTIHMNHSRDFWQLVAAKMPDYAPRRTTLKQAWQYVPRWVDG